jgi:hypothetical protein
MDCFFKEKQKYPLFKNVSKRSQLLPFNFLGLHLKVQGSNPDQRIARNVKMKKNNNHCNFLQQLQYKRLYVQLNNMIDAPGLKKY